MADIVLGYFFQFLYLSGFIGSRLLKALPLMFIICLAIKYYFRNKILRKTTTLKVAQPKLLIAILTLIGIALLRSNMPNATLMNTFFNFSSYVIFVLFTLIVYEYIALKYNSDVTAYHRVIVVPFYLCAIVNILFWAINLRGIREAKNIGASVILSYLGINADRVSFPLTNGINSYGTVIGALLAIELVYFFILKYRTWEVLLGIAVFVVTLILTDSRLALSYPFLICFIMMFLKQKQTIKSVKLFPFLLLLGPILFVSIFQLLSVFSFFQAFSRTSEDLLTGNGRFFIWGIAFEHFLKFLPIHLIGYGAYGHAASGSSELWGTLLAGTSDSSDMLHPHSVLFVILFDYGYLGLTLILSFLYLSCKRIAQLWSSNKEVCIFYLSFLIYFLLIGITESIFGFYYLNAMYIVILFFLLPFNVYPSD